MMGFMNVLWCYLIIWMCSTSQGSSTNGSPAVWIWLCFGTVDVHGFAGIPCTSIILSCDFSGGPNHQVPNKKNDWKVDSPTISMVIYHSIWSSWGAHINHLKSDPQKIWHPWIPQTMVHEVAVIFAGASKLWYPQKVIHGQWVLK